MLALTASGYVTGKPKIESGDYGDFCNISLRCKGDGGKHVFYVNAKFYGKRMATIEKYINDGDQITVTGTVGVALEKAKKDGTKYSAVYLTGAGFTLAARSVPADAPAASRPLPASEDDEVPF
jgi:hypothetical protein